jgi:hypothetical protein
LVGKNLGQFHSDFELEGSVGPVYACKSIFLGKKSYLDILEGKDEKGNIISGNHIRLKGITSEGLLHASKKYTNGYYGLYKKLAKGNEVNFTLNPFNFEDHSEKVLFEFLNGKVNTRPRFCRKVRFT